MMRRRDLFRWFGMWLAALWAACKGERAGPLRSSARAHHKPDHAKGGVGEDGKDWTEWNERKYNRDLEKHGPGVYCYVLEADGKYGDLTHAYPEMVGGRGRVMLPTDAEYAVRVPADSYPKAA